MWMQSDHSPTIPIQRRRTRNPLPSRREGFVEVFYLRKNKWKRRWKSWRPQGSVCTHHQNRVRLRSDERIQSRLSLYERPERVLYMLCPPSPDPTWSPRTHHLEFVCQLHDSGAYLRVEFLTLRSPYIPNSPCESLSSLCGSLNASNKAKSKRILSILE